MRITSKRVASSATATAALLSRFHVLNLLFQQHSHVTTAAFTPTLVSSTFISPKRSSATATCTSYTILSKPLISSTSSLHMTRNMSSKRNCQTTITQNRKILHFESLPSTQDEARTQLISSTTDTDDDLKNSPKKYLAICTTMQTNGRGTSGRSWIGKKGNTFITITIPSDELQIPITLLPLQIGVIMANRIQQEIKKESSSLQQSSSSSSGVKVKWPNDVLINGKKVAGVLIESQRDDTTGDYYYLVGIGINYSYSPKVSQIGPERGREAACIYDHIGMDVEDGNCDNDVDDGIGVDKARDLGICIANDIWDWLETQGVATATADGIIQNFEQWMDFGQELILRDEPGNQVVIPISIEKDGQLRVKNRYGTERLLCVDYLL